MAKQKRTRSTLMITLLRGGCVGLIALGSALNGSVGGEARTSPPTLSVRPAVTATADGLLVDWRAPEAQIVSRADGTTDVLLPGYSQTARPGAPVLPFVSVLVAVPPGAIPTLRVVLVEETDRPLPGPLALAPFPQGVQRDAAGHLIGGGLFAPASSVQPAQSSEGEPVVLEPAGVVRGVRLARLVFYPARPIGNVSPGAPARDDPRARLPHFCRAARRPASRRIARSLVSRPALGGHQPRASSAFNVHHPESTCRTPIQDPKFKRRRLGLDRD